MAGHHHQVGLGSQNTGNALSHARSCIRQSKTFRRHESGNAMKGVLGTPHLGWDLHQKQGAYLGQAVFDAATGGAAVREEGAARAFDWGWERNTMSPPRDFGAQRGGAGAGNMGVGAGGTGDEGCGAGAGNMGDVGVGGSGGQGTPASALAPALAAASPWMGYDLTLGGAAALRREQQRPRHDAQQQGSRSAALAGGAGGQPGNGKPTTKMPGAPRHGGSQLDAMLRQRAVARAEAERAEVLLRQGARGGTSVVRARRGKTVGESASVWATSNASYGAASARR